MRSTGAYTVIISFTTVLVNSGG